MTSATMIFALAWVYPRDQPVLSERSVPPESVRPVTVSDHKPGLSAVATSIVRPAPAQAGVCGISGPAGACASSLDCTTEICVDDACVISGAGGHCSSGPDCTTGTCTNGECGQSAAGGACGTNADCVSNLCSNSLCLASGLPSGTACHLDGQCRTGVCSGGACAKADVGGVCGDNIDCTSGACDSGVCAESGRRPHLHFQRGLHNWRL